MNYSLGLQADALDDRKTAIYNLQRKGQVGQTTDREQGADNWLAEEESGGAGGAGEG